MMNRIFDFMEKYIELSETEKDFVAQQHSIKKFHRKDMVPILGVPDDLSYFVLEGEVALYRADLGRETVSEFFFSGEPVIVPENHGNSFMLCLSDTSFAVSAAKKVEKLLLELPRFEHVCRRFAEERLSYLMQFSDKLKGLGPLEKYQFIVSERPELVSRVPLHVLAQYLGLAPETLSRVRRQIKNLDLD